MFWFLLGFTILGTAAAGGGVLSLVGGLAVMVFSSVLFKAARVREDA